MHFASIWSIALNPFVVAIVLYLLALVGVGFYKARSVKNSDDFMVAGRSLPCFVLVGTLLATWIGSGSLFSGAGLGYRNGLAGLWSSGGAWIGIVLVFFIAKRIRSLGKVTVPDVFEMRYGKLAATLATITTVIAYLTIVSYQFKGGGKVLTIITEGAISIEAGIVITALFAILYTLLAGMLSVVYTDVVNGILMSIGCLATLGYMLVHVGGLDAVISSAEAAGKWSLFGHWAAESKSGASGPIIAISFCVPTMLLLLGDANMYQRIFSARNPSTARKAVLFWVIGVVILESSISLLGLTGSVAAEQNLIPNLAANGASGTENVIPTLALKGVPTALGMLLVATMMAVIVSTADSFLLIPATNLTRDVYQRWISPHASQKRVILISRLLVLGLGFVAFLLVNQFPTVLAAAYTAYLIYGASITPALLAAFLWKRATRTGAVASILTGAVVTLLWKFGLDTSSWHPLLQEVTFPAAGLSIFALVAGSLVTPAPDRRLWEPFFARGGAPTT
ncbi:MAG: sodium:solute symporter [Planctomycetes bacterium]|nr:sodium:solute symporter [Planctomycetota bacterium]MDP6423527.1 sodium:solute symporter family protein [Planctomycetota bacterium]